MKNTIYLLTLFLMFFSCKKKTNEASIDKETREVSILEKIANAHGFKNWDNVEELVYTFNVDRGDNHYARAWVWQPKTNKIKMTTGKDTISYTRDLPLDSIYLNADKGFINDKYWLLVPFNLIWDKNNFTYTYSESEISPIKEENMQKLTIVYSNEGGYTPGDAYDLYFNEDYLIKEWVYRKENTKEISLATTKENYIDIQGLKIATSHKNKEGSFHLYFSDLK